MSDLHGAYCASLVFHARVDNDAHLSALRAFYQSDAGKAINERARAAASAASKYLYTQAYNAAFDAALAAEGENGARVADWLRCCGASN